MSEFITRVAKLVPYNKRPKALAGIATAFMFEPETIDGRNFGSLFVVLEVLATSKQAHEVSDLIIQTAGHTYYNQHIDTSTTPGALLHELRFETAIKAVNTQLAKYLASGHSSWVGKLSAVIAVICGGQLQISQAGSVEINLYRSGRTTRLSQAPTVAEKQSGQTFPSIAGGHLEAMDKLVFATPALLHHLSVAELKNFIIDNSPSSAVHKIHERLNGSSQADRVAMLAIEVTTPEIASLSTLSSGSSELEIGAPSGPLDAAKIAASPAAEAALGFGSQIIKKTADFTRNRLIPAVRRLLQILATYLRGWMANRKHHKYLLAAVIIIIVALLYLNFVSRQQARLILLNDRYKAALTSEQSAESQISKGDQVGARKSLAGAQDQISALQSDPLASKLDAKLKSSVHPEYDPASITGLEKLIRAKIDLVDGLFKAKATLVTDFAAIPGAVPNFFELTGTKAYFYDNRATSIYLYDLSTGKLSTGAGNKTIPPVVAMTTSGLGDGLFLFTSKPSLWFYRFEDDSFTEQNLALGDWPKGQSISSYNSNLYILASDSSQVYKFGRTLSGFNGRSNYLPADAVDSLKGATALTVDGALITDGPNGLRRYIAGVLMQSNSQLPTEISHPSSVRSFTDGTLLLITDQTSGRVGLVSLENDALIFKKQYQFESLQIVRDAIPQARSGLIFILADGKLYKSALSF